MTRALLLALLLPTAVLAQAAPDAKVSPSPDTKVSPTPDTKVSPTPDTKVSPTPDTKVSPSPDIQRKTYDFPDDVIETYCYLPEHVCFEPRKPARLVRVPESFPDRTRTLPAR